MKIKTPPILLRYPGGKSRKVGNLLPLLAGPVEKRGRFLEPFVGGGAMALTVAEYFPGVAIHINDADPNIFAFWDLAVSGTDEEIGAFASLLSRGASLALFDEERERCKSPERSRAMKAYHAVFFSKTTHNGIFTASPIGGRDQEGKTWKVDCQFNPSRMVKTFSKIRNLLQGTPTTVTNESAIILLARLPSDVPAYLDPPYYVAGKKCYPVWMSENEHVDLARILRERTNWLMSYDDCSEIRDLYEWATVEEFQLLYSMASHGTDRNWKKKTELLIQP